MPESRNVDSREGDWKNQHANESGKALDHPLVKDVIEELMENLGTESGLVKYGITKVAMYAAQVARAQCLGFDPEALRLTEDEANAALIRKARMMVEAGVPTTVIVGPGEHDE